MPPGGGPPNQFGLDTTNFDKQIEKVLNRFTKLSTGMQASAAAAATFNAQGRLTEVVVNSISNSGAKVVTNLTRVGRTWQQTTNIVTDSVNRILREQQRLTAEQNRRNEQGQRFQATQLFRPRLDVEAQRLPANASSVDTRFFTNAQRDLEKFVISGKVSGVRAIQILNEVQQGSKARLIGMEEDFRVAALRMFAQQRNIIRAANQATSREQGRVESTQTKSFLEGVFGPINPAASAAMVSSVQSTMNRMANIVQTQGVSSFQRFQDLVRGVATGTAQPLNTTERNIVRMTEEITRQYNAAAAAANTLTEAQKRQAAASTLGSNLRARLGPAYDKASPVDRERIDAQIARLEQLRSRSRDPLSDTGAARAIDAGLSGKGGGGFTGVESQARRAAARIRAIIQGELKDPFKIDFAIGNNFNFVKGLYTGQFLTRLVGDFEQVVSAAASYQRSIALIQTITDDVKVPFQTWSNAIREVSDELGKPIADVAAAGYDVLSNQVTSYVQDTKSVLMTAGQFATVTNSTVEDSVNLISSAINTFKLNANDAERVAAQFFTTIDLGRVKTAEMANSIGRSAVFAKTLGVSLEELQAGIITITQTGQKADSSFTLLNNVFQKLLNPTKELQAYYDRLGVSTGDVFVKTYGFTGALRMLSQETQGSASKLADFFNEIRAFGGVDALISRAHVFEDALKQLGNSTETLDKAKEKFEDLPGQKFLVEMNKAKNLFLTVVQTEILETIVGLTDNFGGLASAISATTSVAVGFAGAMTFSTIVKGVASIRAESEAATSAMAALTGVTQKYNAFAVYGYAAAAGAAAGIAIALVAAYDAHVHYYDRIKADADKAAQEEIDAANAASAARIQEWQKTLNAQSQGLLRNLTLNKRVLQDLAAESEATGKRLSASLKNAYENSFSTARNILDELRNKQRDLLKSASDYEKGGRNKIIDKFNDDQFRARMNKAEMNGGNFREQASLYKNRLTDLASRASKAAAKGDREHLRELLDERDRIVDEMANKTKTVFNKMDRFGVVRARQEVPLFDGAEAFRRRALLQRLALEEQVTAEQKKQGLALQPAIGNIADKLQSLEDAQKEVASFKLTDDGKSLYKNQAEAVKSLQDKRAEIARLVKDIETMAGPNDKLLQRDLFKTQNKLADARAEQRLEQVKKEFAIQAQLEGQNNAIDNTIKKMGEDGVDRMREAEKKITEASAIMIQATKNSQAKLKNVFEATLFQSESGPFGKLPDPTSRIDRFLHDPGAVKRVEIQQEVDSAVKAGNFDLALKKIDELTAHLREYKKLETEVFAEGGEKKSIGAILKESRDEILTARTSQDRKANAEGVRDSANLDMTRLQNGINRVSQQYRALGQTDDEVVKKLISNQKLFDGALQNTKRIVQELNTSITQIGPNADELEAAAINRRQFRGQAVVPPAPNFNPNVRQLNNFNGAQQQPNANVPQNVNVNVNVQAAPKEEITGQKIGDAVRRELRRDPQPLGAQK